MDKGGKGQGQQIRLYLLSWLDFRPSYFDVTLFDFPICKRAGCFPSC